MATTDLTDIELETLAAVNGTWAKSQMLNSVKTRLILLELIERRAWPNGPLWRTAKGEKLVPAGNRHNGF